MSFIFFLFQQEQPRRRSLDCFSAHHDSSNIFVFLISSFFFFLSLLHFHEGVHAFLLHSVRDAIRLACLVPCIPLGEFLACARSKACEKELRIDEQLAAFKANTNETSSGHSFIPTWIILKGLLFFIRAVSDLVTTTHARFLAGSVPSMILQSRHEPIDPFGKTSPALFLLGGSGPTNVFGHDTIHSHHNIRAVSEWVSE